MWISRLDIRGLAGTEDALTGSPERIASEQDPRLIDALALFAAALAPTRRNGTADRMGWPTTFDDDELALPTSATVAQQAAHPAIVVEACVELDPPLFGRLREAVLRDPALASGLADGTMTIRVGWAFTRDRRVVRADVLGVAVGDVAVPLSELPAWWPEVAVAVGERIRLVGGTSIASIGASLRTALLSADPDQRERASSVLAWGGWAVVDDAGHVDVRQASTLLPLRWRGPDEVHRLQLAHAALLLQPDVLVCTRRPTGELLDALTAWTTGETAVLEQIVLP